MAELVRDDVEESRFVGYDFLREFDGGMVFVRSARRAVGVSGSGTFSAPVRASGGGVQGFGPDYLDAVGRGREVADLVGGDAGGR